MKLLTKDLTRVSLFIAITIILSQIIIPINPVPISLSMIAVFLSGGILGWKRGTISQVVYILLGIAGLPVFAGFKGGLGIIFGPTGGYLVGYITTAFIIGFVLEKRQAKNVIIIMCSMVLGLISCYLLGTIWLAFVLHLGFVEALSIGVLPYIFGDLLKILLSAYLVKRLGRYI